MFRRFACIAGFTFIGLVLTPALAEVPFTLAFPVACTLGHDCIVQNYVDHHGATGARDFTCNSLTYSGHDGTDIRIPSIAAMRAGMIVLASASGTVKRIRDGVPDISIRATNAPDIQGRECGNAVMIDHGDGWETQYCHMVSGSISVSPGQIVKQGDPIGRVGLSGQTEFPHLHLTVRHYGQMIDPFAPTLAADQCGITGDGSLWKKGPSQPQYKDAFVLNSGFSETTVTSDDIEKGDLETKRPTLTSNALVFFARVVGLKPGDLARIVVTGPDGKSIIDRQFDPLPSAKAQFTVYAGAKKPSSGWQSGVYEALFQIMRGEAAIAEMRQQLHL